MPRAYDDMDGIGSFNFGSDLGEMYSADMFKDSLIAAGAGAGALVLSAFLIPKIPAPSMLTAQNQSRFRAGVGLVVAMLAGRGMWDVNRDAAMGIIGGVGGVALAQLIDSFLGADILRGTPLGALPDGSELSAADQAILDSYDGARTLASLETPGVQMSSGAFADPTVTREQLMGFGGTVVQTETLGYQPYLS